MAAREHEAQAFVRDGAHVVVLLRPEPFEPCEELGLPRERAFTADPVDRAVPRGRDDPGGRIARRAVRRPALDGSGKRVLNGVFGELEVTEDADEDRQGTAPLLAEEGLDRYCSTSGRISTDPLSASGMRCANSIAWSRSLQSARK